MFFPFLQVEEKNFWYKTVSSLLLSLLQKSIKRSLFPTCLVQKIHRHHISTSFLSTHSCVFSRMSLKLLRIVLISCSPHQQWISSAARREYCCGGWPEEQQISPVLYQTVDIHCLQSFALLFVAFGGLNRFIVVLQIGFVVSKEKHA